LKKKRFLLINKGRESLAEQENLLSSGKKNLNFAQNYALKISILPKNNPKNINFFTGVWASSLARRAISPLERVRDNLVSIKKRFELTHFFNFIK
jgi:hypothetical protein